MMFNQKFFFLWREDNISSLNDLFPAIGYLISAYFKKRASKC